MQNNLKNAGIIGAVILALLGAKIFATPGDVETLKSYANGTFVTKADMAGILTDIRDRLNSIERKIDHIREQ